MRLSDKQISELKKMYVDVHCKTLSNEEAQTAGLAIMRLVYVKESRKRQLTNKENNNAIKCKTN